MNEVDEAIHKIMLNKRYDDAIFSFECDDTDDGFIAFLDFYLEGFLYLKSRCPKCGDE